MCFPSIVVMIREGFLFTIMENLELYNKVRSCPDEAKKTIQAGKLKGYTDINPMWRIKVLTEHFGICGIGWYYEEVERWTDETANNEIGAYIKIHLYVKINDQWSKPILGIGGNKLCGKGVGDGQNDEAWKMALTDALSVACKNLGIAADVYFEKDRTKYDMELKAEEYEHNLLIAIDEAERANSRHELEDVWKRYSQAYEKNNEFISAFQRMAVKYPKQ